MNTKLIIVGGFLGAGKTTTLWELAHFYSNQGKKVGLITNDQASELVDTVFLEKSGGVTKEVSGSCFCCNFKGFTEAIDNMLLQGIEIIIAEPVGSCTDLSATILQPLKEFFKEKIQLTPLNVLIDPGKLKSAIKKKDYGIHESAAYILHKQLEEADYILLNKKDLLSEKEVSQLIADAKIQWPLAKVFGISGLKGDNIPDWMNALERDNKIGTHLLEIDYNIYAEGEAVLGWLNSKVNLKSRENKETDWKEYVTRLLENMETYFSASKKEIGHIKLFIEEKDNFIIGNLTGKRDTLKVRGTSHKDNEVILTINTRVEMEPEALERLVRKVLMETFSEEVESEIKIVKCLKPGRPEPTYRYKNIV